jgi:hypothetical protein
MSVMSSNPQRPAVSLETLRSYVEGYPQGGRIARHSHDQDQLALISDSAAIIETDAVYVVHPLLKALWLPAGVEAVRVGSDVLVRSVRDQDSGGGATAPDG